jgi:hypothetical protein
MKIGLLVGREWSFPPAFIEEVSRRGEGVTAEYVKLGGTRMDEPCPYAVLIDRISHEVPYYRVYLKNAVVQGTAVVNNPFMWTADDKFFEYVGLPCVLKDAHGGGWKNVSVCHTLDELVHHYNQSGLLTMIVQEFIRWDHYVRCLCLGQEDVLAIKYDPHARKYHVEHGHLSPELGKRVVEDSLKLVRALGYDMNSVEWAIRDGVPYAIDFMNPAPDMDVHSLTPFYFEWAVKHMADMAIRLAKNPRPQPKELRWAALF